MRTTNSAEYVEKYVVAEVNQFGAHRSGVGAQIPLRRCERVRHLAARRVYDREGAPLFIAAIWPPPWCMDEASGLAEARDWPRVLAANPRGAGLPLKPGKRRVAL